LDTDECFLTLQRSAFSTNIKERHDHSVAILDGRGRLMVQAENALPIGFRCLAGASANLSNVIFRAVAVPPGTHAALHFHPFAGALAELAASLGNFL